MDLPRKGDRQTVMDGGGGREREDQWGEGEEEVEEENMDTDN